LSSPSTFHQRLGLFDTTAIVVGSMIGSAIFFARQERKTA
jgi:amino acid transporter